MAELNDSQIILLKILENALNKNSEYTGKISRTVVKESIYQGVSLLAYSASECGVCEEKLRRQWKTYSDRELYNSLKNKSYHITLDKLMRENGIKYCVIKGCASAGYYPEPEKRAMGDVDFLVAPEDYQRAGKVFKDNGFDTLVEEHICHKVFVKGSMRFEMHSEPAGIPANKYGDIIRNYLKSIFNDAAEAPEGFIVPNGFHHGLILILHTYSHLYGEGIGLRQLCDLAAFLNRFSEAEIREMYEEKLNAVGLWRFFCVFGLILHKYLGIPKQAWMSDDVELAELLICDIMSGGNMGRKDKSRSYQGMMISDRGKNGVTNNKIKTLIKSANNVAYYQFGFLKKHKSLSKFGFIIIGGRYAFRVLRGKRKMLSNETFNRANERREIYKRLNLFEKR